MTREDQSDGTPLASPRCARVPVLNQLIGQVTLCDLCKNLRKLQCHSDTVAANAHTSIPELVLPFEIWKG